MSIMAYNPPHIRHRDSERTLMDDVIIVLLAIYFMACYYYGPRAVLLGLFSVGIALLCDIVCKLLLHHPISFYDHSSFVTALIIPLLLPACVRYSLVAVAVIFALIVVKYPFGGVGYNIFNPAAGGFAFVAICFPQEVFSYPMPLERLPLWGIYEGRTVFSAAYTLKAGGIPTTGGFLELLLGNAAGPMGATNVLVTCACLLYLLVRGTVRWQCPVFFLSTCMVIAWIFPRASIEGGASVLYELFSGFLIFGAVFMLSDPVTSPKRGTAIGAYAVLAGISVMLFRRFGGFEESFAFALLLCNALTPLLDYADELLFKQIRRKRLEFGKNTKIS